MNIGGDEVAALVDGGGAGILDVRTVEEYEGRAGYPCDPRQGHIPGAVQLDWESLYAGPGRPHGAETIRGLLVGCAVDPDGPLVAYCHSGQRSAFAVVALRAAGLDARNYEGSWHEWSRRS